MYDKEFTELVKIAVENLKEGTVYQMIQRSADYERESVAGGLAEQRYMELDLTEQQRKVCDDFFNCRDNQNLEYADYSYIAGLYDAFRILAILFPDRWDMEQIMKVLCFNLKTE